MRRAAPAVSNSSWRKGSQICYQGGDVNLLIRERRRAKIQVSGAVGLAIRRAFSFQREFRLVFRDVKQPKWLTEIFRHPARALKAPIRRLPSRRIQYNHLTVRIE